MLRTASDMPLDRNLGSGAFCARAKAGVLFILGSSTFEPFPKSCDQEVEPIALRSAAGGRAPAVRHRVRKHRVKAHHDGFSVQGPLSFRPVLNYSQGLSCHVG
jgi:hypothetical protein